MFFMFISHLQNTVLTKEGNKVCGTILVPKRGEVIWEWRNFYDLHNMSWAVR